MALLSSNRKSSATRALGLALSCTSLSALTIAPGCDRSPNAAPLPSVREFIPAYPNAVEQAEDFVRRVEIAKGSGKPVVAWLKVNHRPRGELFGVKMAPIPQLAGIVDELVAASQFEALWFLHSLKSPRLLVAEGAKSIEGEGSIGQTTRELSADLASYHFPNGLPETFSSLTLPQIEYLANLGAHAISFGLGDVQAIYPAGDPKILDRVDAAIEEYEARYGGEIPSPYPDEYKDLIFRQREIPLVTYLVHLSTLPEHQGKVLVLEYGRLHQDLSDRLREAGFEVVELECGSALEQFTLNLKTFVEANRSPIRE